jgi:hypothetical protein
MEPAEWVACKKDLLAKLGCMYSYVIRQFWSTRELQGLRMNRVVGSLSSLRLPKLIFRCPLESEQSGVAQTLSLLTPDECGPV